MPYRAELKRPDLKGQFPCSVCGKIFCHSSSLSRHRMQAHFKSYTCTQCNQEISSNETLRSHMFRMHSISRMFMCRCCNWAFPDKTSLHIHMQSMLRNGTPGDVAVLARSSTEDGPMDGLPESNPIFLGDVLKHTVTSSNNNNSTAPNNNVGSIFPNMMKSDSLLQYLRKDGMPPLDISTLSSSNQWLAAWLANNPFASNLGLIGANTPTEHTAEHEEIDDNEGDDDFDVLKIETTEEDLQEEEEEANKCSPRSLTTKSESGDEDKRDEGRGSQKRKATRPQQVTEEGETPLKVALEEKDGPATEQLSPTVSDSHTSGSCHADHPAESPHKCFDCQVAKARLNISESKIREYEQKIQHLESKVAELQRNVAKEEFRHDPRNIQMASTSGPPMGMFAMPAPMPFMQNPAMKMLFHNLMQAQINRQSC